MKIEVVDSPTGLLLIHVSDRERLACEAAHNRFLLDHGFKEWTLSVRTSFTEGVLVAQSIDPDGRASNEIRIAAWSEIRVSLMTLLEAALSCWMEPSRALSASERG